MSAIQLDGRAIARRLQAELRKEVEELAKQGIFPAFGTILVGNDPRSASFVRSKHKACHAVGIATRAQGFSADSSPSELLDLIDQWNRDKTVDGILVQLPLPNNFSAETIIDHILPTKEVDGLHPLNRGLLALRHRTPYFIPPTPSAVMVLLQETGIALEGKQAVVIGRSDLVGMPTALLLERANATVTLCHRHTADLPTLLRQAEIVVVAAGCPDLVRGADLREGCIVIDVGLNEWIDPTDSETRRFVGDVEFDSAVEVAGFITPVPGGVGPLTITMLLHNIVLAAQRRLTSTKLL